MKNNIQKRILTSFLLLFLLYLSYSFVYILISSLIIISIILWIEFNALISKIFNLQKKINLIIQFLIKFFSFIYIIFFSSIIFVYLNNESVLDDKIFYLFILFICITSDIGGLLFGKVFKGPKLTKISPKKTISGALGSFLLPLFFTFFFQFYIFNITLLNLIIITFFVSLCSQLGDLFISYLKRKANVKDTSNILPGHGGFLDRLDGIIFTIPLVYIFFNIF